jgi:hypothetical protein
MKIIIFKKGQVLFIHVLTFTVLVKLLKNITSGSVGSILCQSSVMVLSSVST